jgi:hypothetical protein
MERTQIFDLMGELKLYGMKAAFDEIMATAVKRQHEPQRIVGDLLNAEINEKQARSIKYQLTIAKLPLAKDIADFQFDSTPINQTLVNDLAGGVVPSVGPPEVVVTGTIGDRRMTKRQCGRRHDVGRGRGFALPGQDVEHDIGGMNAVTERFGAGGIHRGKAVGRTALRISTICLLPSSVLASLRRTRSIAPGSTQSLKGAPLRKAPGLRASTGT